MTSVVTGVSSVITMVIIDPSIDVLGFARSDRLLKQPQRLIAPWRRLYQD
jgi:hypothetical protein